jgi:hypothetical protein
MAYRSGMLYNKATTARPARLMRLQRVRLRQLPESLHKG